MWKELAEDKKLKYVNLSVKDKKRYKKEMDEMKTKGYFTNKDGVKSTETLTSGAFKFMEKYYSFMP